MTYNFSSSAVRKSALLLAVIFVTAMAVWAVMPKESYALPDIGGAKVYGVNGEVIGYVTSTATWFSGGNSPFDLIDKNLGVIETTNFLEENPFIPKIGTPTIMPLYYASTDCSGKTYTDPLGLTNAGTPFSVLSSLLLGFDNRFYIVNRQQFPRQGFNFNSTNNGNGCVSTVGTVAKAYPLRDVTNIINSYHVDHIGI